MSKTSGLSVNLTKSLLFAVCGTALLSGCAQPFDYDKASVEDRKLWLESTSQGMYDGLEKTIPHGANGIYMQMGKQVAFPDRRRIEITVNVQDGGDNIRSGPEIRKEILRGICPKYVGTDLERNKVSIYTAFKLEGGGTALSVTIDPEKCADALT